VTRKRAAVHNEGDGKGSRYDGAFLLTCFSYYGRRRRPSA
jgi:hypothetical protein